MTLKKEVKTVFTLSCDVCGKEKQEETCKELAKSFNEKGGWSCTVINKKKGHKCDDCGVK